MFLATYVSIDNIFEKYHWLARALLKLNHTIENLHKYRWIFLGYFAKILSYFYAYFFQVRIFHSRQRSERERDAESQNTNTNTKTPTLTPTKKHQHEKAKISLDHKSWSTADVTDFSDTGSGKNGNSSGVEPKHVTSFPNWTEKLTDNGKKLRKTWDRFN